MYKRNYYLSKIQPFIGRPVIKVITGMRRVGKSWFLRQLLTDLESREVPARNVLLVDKESLEFDHIKMYSDLNNLVTTRFRRAQGAKYLFVDEIQEIKEWEKAVASLMNRGDIDVYITGSNAHLFSSEIATLISGRYIDFPIYSLSFEEFGLFRRAAGTPREELFREYLRYGGMPAIHHFDLSDEIVYQYISSIFDTVLLKDIVKRHNVRNVHLLENITRYLFDNIGNVFSAKSVSDYMKSQRLKVSVNTVQNYIGYITSALLAHRVSRFDIKGKRILEIYDKYYLADIGIRHALLGYREGDISGLLENVVFLELLRRGYKVNIGKLGDKEVDFIATREKEKIYIQVVYLLESMDTVEREFNVLLQIPDNYPKYVLSMDTSFGGDFKGIERLNLVDFLSSE